ncbi:ribbon-helix-helix protein, CopG family [Halomonas sp. BN3-1]|uniref:ribbon-helix-helix protein, CopG family n=1 Tax=Halomonas sp. BN3-1 TaxID=2082393 RepID=UPI000D389DE4|nr:ribbon-helix-helix protein, CopG family [Halomonas sp. BN3-1]
MTQKNPQFNLRLDPEVKDWLDAKAKEMRLSRTWIINNLARQEMKRDRQETA